MSIDPTYEDKRSLNLSHLIHAVIHVNVHSCVRITLEGDRNALSPNARSVVDFPLTYLVPHHDPELYLLELERHIKVQYSCVKLVLFSFRGEIADVERDRIIPVHQGFRKRILGYDDPVL